ncbi:hypothetical protein DPEC_G00351370 [Dallia pectoralis]|uniref:Uncharacterized protein n=1 Tax=Dallia pectoralis TaxID=75939 RepID=A0ACC2F1X0_DALPE|nr:hypothetical protein DPEC_G00351370 [Dallia pectoralis]
MWNIIVVLIAAGACAQYVIQRPEEIVCKLSQKVTFNCEFIHTPDQQVDQNPILYWHNIHERNTTELWPQSQSESQYKDRVDVLDRNQNSQNKSLLLKNVQWEDSNGKYECKLSYRTGNRSARKKGSGVKLLIYDSLFFNYDPDDNATLLCAVNASWDPRFVLSVLHGGTQAALLLRNTTGPFQLITPLSIRLPLENGKDYECQLNLSSIVILSQTFKQSSKTPAAEKRFPEPVSLFVAILLVPIIVLLFLLIACWHTKA